VQKACQSAGAPLNPDEATVSRKQPGCGNTLRLLAAVTIWLAGASCALAQPSLLDQLFERHVRVKAAVGAGVLHVLYQRKADPQASPTTCYRRYVPGKGWLKEEVLDIAHNCVAFFDGGLYVFRDDGYTVYKTGDWRQPSLFGEGGASTWEARQWPFEWAPKAACVLGNALLAFGTKEGAGTLRVAAVEEGGPRDLEAPLSRPARFTDITAIPDGEDAMVFWHESTGENGPTELWGAAFDGSRWQEPHHVPVPYARNDYAAAFYDRSLWVFAKPRGERVRRSRPIVSLRWVEDKWSEPTAVERALDPKFDWTLDISATAFEGTLYLFRACKNRVVAHRLSEGKWLEPLTLIELSPWPTLLFWWLFGNVVACLVLLPALALVAFATRDRPRPTLSVGELELRMASWPRRVAAQLVDVVATLLLCSLIGSWLGLADGRVAMESEYLAPSVALYSGVYLAYFLLGEGLSGQSLGKWVMRIAVITTGGRRARLARIALRNLLRPWPFLVPAAYLIGSIVLLLSRGNQRLGDMAAGTCVVELPPPVMPERRP